MPFSKCLLKYSPPTFLAGLLYFGAGIRIGTCFIIRRKHIPKNELLAKKDLPYTIGKIILNVLAPILLMVGLSKTTSSTSSLLNNFEIVAIS